MFTSSIRKGIKRFYVKVVQWTSKKCFKKVQAFSRLLFCSSHNTKGVFDVVIVIVVVVVAEAPYSLLRLNFLTL